jgi:hypothetical protein
MTKAYIRIHPFPFEPYMSHNSKCAKLYYGFPHCRCCHNLSPPGPQPGRNPIINRFSVSNPKRRSLWPSRKWKPLTVWNSCYQCFILAGGSSASNSIKGQLHSSATRWSGRYIYWRYHWAFATLASGLEIEIESCRIVEFILHIYQTRHVASCISHRRRSLWKCSESRIGRDTWPSS